MVAAPMSFFFHEYRLDTSARQLVRHGRPVPLSPKAFELLKVLVAERPRALSKAELLERVWPGVFVTEASLARVINEIRRRLGERARSGRIIRTVHAFGYAFAAPVREDDPTEQTREDHAPSGCWFSCQGREYALAAGQHIIGREPGLAVRLDSPKVSRRHARVVVHGGQATIEDLGSKNGTFVREERIAGPVTLEAGDTVRVGGFRLVFHMAARQLPTESEVQSES